MDRNININEEFGKACRYCSRGEKCDSDVIKYLKNNGLSNSEIENILEKLKTYDFINIDRYVNAFINDKFKFNKWGKNKIINELKAKKIDYKIISKHIEKIEEEEYITVLKHILNNKLRQTKDKDEYSQKASLIRYGLSKGFEYDKIDKVLNMMKNDK